jgi:hypothetical protein
MARRNGAACLLGAESQASVRAPMPAVRSNEARQSTQFICKFVCDPLRHTKLRIARFILSHVDLIDPAGRSLTGVDIAIDGFHYAQIANIFVRDAHVTAPNASRAQVSKI